jgi:hypothetical protein
VLPRRRFRSSALRACGVILSSISDHASDLGCCVLDSVGDGVGLGCFSAGADRFGCRSLRRVAVMEFAAYVGGPTVSECFGECVAELLVLVVQGADARGGRFETAQ